MKYLLSLFFLLASLSAFCQSAPEVVGELIQSGPLVFQNKVVGHFQLTDNQQPGDKVYAYTITLLGNDLQPLGSKVYKSEEPLVFEDIAYNGSYLGVLFKGQEEGGKRHVDVLDRSGERVQRGTLRESEASRGVFLLPTAKGFLSCLVRVNAFQSVVFDLDLLASTPGAKGWKRTYEGRFNVRGGVIPRLVTANEDRILLETRSINGYQTKFFKDLYSIDIKTGELIYKDLQEKASKTGYGGGILGGVLNGLEAVTIKDLSPVSTSKKGKGFEIKHFDEKGELIRSKKFYDEAIMKKKLAENKLPSLIKGARLKRIGIQLNEEGAATIIYNLVSGRDKQGKYFHGYEYRDAFIVVITPDFELGPMMKIETKHFILGPGDTEPLTSGEMSKLQRRIRKGQYEKLDLDELVSLHNGPYGFAFASHGPDFISNFFLDRVFRKEGVAYFGIRAVTYIDGEFEEDYISFKSKPDFISLSRAREGYLKVTEYGYGKGVVDTRLERLSY